MYFCWCKESFTEILIKVSSGPEWEIAYPGHVAATGRFNSKMQLFLGRLNLGPRTKAKNKLKWKEYKKSQQKGRKATMCTSGAKQYWIAWSVKHEKKRELQVSLTPKKVPHTLYSVKYKSLQKRRWKLIHYIFNYQGI